MSLMTPKYRQLPVKLTDAERMARALRAAELQAEYNLVELRKKETARELGLELKRLRERIEEAQQAVRTGEEPQSVQIEHRRNEERRTIETVRLDTGEIIDTRPMTAEERQGKLFAISGGKTKDERATASSVSSGKPKRRRKAAPGEPKDTSGSADEGTPES